MLSGQKIPKGDCYKQQQTCNPLFSSLKAPFVKQSHTESYEHKVCMVQSTATQMQTIKVLGGFYPLTHIELSVFTRDQGRREITEFQSSSIQEFTVTERKTNGWDTRLLPQTSTQPHHGQASSPRGTRPAQGSPVRAAGHGGGGGRPSPASPCQRWPAPNAGESPQNRPHRPAERPGPFWGGRAGGAQSAPGQRGQRGGSGGGAAVPRCGEAPRGGPAPTLPVSAAGAPRGRPAGPGRAGAPRSPGHGSISLEPARARPRRRRRRPRSRSPAAPPPAGASQPRKRPPPSSPANQSAEAPVSGMRSDQWSASTWGS